MAKYKVLQHFEAFERGYRAGEVLTDFDLECWLPESARATKLASLRLTSYLEPVPDEAPAVEEAAPVREMYHDVAHDDHAE